MNEIGAGDAGYSPSVDVLAFCSKNWLSRISVSASHDSAHIEHGFLRSSLEGTSLKPSRELSRFKDSDRNFRGRPLTKHTS